MICKFAINGFGRIGRTVFRRFVEQGSLSSIVAINDLASPDSLAYLLKYDSTHGVLPCSVSNERDSLIVDGHRVLIFSESDPSKIGWGQCGVDVVIESTGRFCSKEGASLHLKGGARFVLVSAPAKGVDSLVWGTNHVKAISSCDKVFSAASCTTNCAVPLLDVLDRAFGIETCSLSTIHATTSSQTILDAPSSKKMRLCRSSLQNIIPTSTGASNAVEEVLPQLKGRLVGTSYRVPLPDVSLLDLVLTFRSSVTLSEVIQTLKAAASGDYKGIISVTDEHLVSKDLQGDSHSSIVDSKASAGIEGRLIKLVAWYDNESGYSARVVDLVHFICDQCLGC
ncbi:type I glyceraldehyde-3-phosphate dehydrogenase [Candidatus Similichlamydia epinepheli]|uniref:type I glyceraldehyde-3-phosphate dehydrogenase n=1 Tax=Candidatus Similichlamydia epinepheli TaxID=1903953 RepID=UPI000D3CCA9D|nr:type I glyceraldehyde-3-phosphate dehydrogenase [Candidatus Similichlamydia epinepheli]